MDVITNGGEKMTQYKAGDKVKIKSWKAMEKEFGLNSVGDILCPGSFLVSMEESVPEDRIATLTVGSSDNTFYWEGLGSLYPDMIECLESEIPGDTAPKGRGSWDDDIEEDPTKTYEFEHARAEKLEKIITGKNKELMMLEDVIKGISTGDKSHDREWIELQYRCDRSEERLRVIEAVLNPERY